MEPPHLPDVFASRPVQVVGKWRGEQSGSVRLTGLLADGSAWEFNARLEALQAASVAAVPLLWARSRIALLSDYASQHWDTHASEETITQLGLNFSLMTQHTSFVAVDSNSSWPDACRARTNNATQLG